MLVVVLEVPGDRVGAGIEALCGEFVGGARRPVRRSLLVSRRGRCARSS